MRSPVGTVLRAGFESSHRLTFPPPRLHEEMRQLLGERHKIRNERQISHLLKVHQQENEHEQRDGEEEEPSVPD